MIGTKFYKPLQDNKLPVWGDVRYEVEDPETGEKHVETRKEIVGYEPNPAPNTLNKYSEAAHWCNENDAHIEDRGDYYEVVKNEHYVPTFEEKAEAIRAERDSKIAETDYAVLVDAPFEPAQVEEVKVYRQALRDVPEQDTFPEKVEWPVKPKFLK